VTIGSKRLGLMLVVVGVVGLVSVSAIGATVPGSGNPARNWMGLGRMSSMHAWMHGYGSGGRAVPSPSPGAAEVTVVARDFFFLPSEVRVSAGDTVNLVLENQGSLPHDITIPALGFSLLAAPAATASTALSASRPGTYQFFCSVSGHREAGMTGELVVG
jgi:nitrite reductase (NO-forming)